MSYTRRPAIPDRKNDTSNIIWINDALEEFSPPQHSVLGITSIGDGLSLTIARYSEDGKSCTYTNEAEIVVDTDTFIKCLLATIDKDTLVWAAQLPPQLVTLLAQRIMSTFTEEARRG